MDLLVPPPRMAVTGLGATVHVSEGALDRGDDQLFDVKTLLMAASWLARQGFRAGKFAAGLLLYSVGVRQRPRLRDVGRNSSAAVAALLRATWLVVAGIKQIIGADRFLSQAGAIAAFQIVSYALRQARLLQPRLDVLRGNAMVPLLSSLGVGALMDWSETNTRVASLRLALQRCISYAEYRHVCAALDNASGMTAWRESDTALPAGFLDAPELRRRIARYSRLQESGDAAALMWTLRAELHRRPGGSGSPQLYGVAAGGTKMVVEEHVRAVAGALDHICDSAPDADIPQRLGFFQETRHAFGRTALLLSGGATNGIYHLGVIRALKRVHLLPPIVSGASAGSIVAALLGCKTDEEMEPILNDGKFDTRFFRVIDPRLKTGGRSATLPPSSAVGPAADSPGSSVLDALHWLWNAATMYNEQRAVFESDFLADTLRGELGDLTFREAFQRTGRIVNIPVAPQRRGDFPRLLNYLTAPHVVVWSASVASCAIPGVFRPVELVAKDDHGELRPYNSAGHRWTDGSIELDLPMQRLAELFNVNLFIVSQVNPHAALLALEGPTGRASALPLLLRFLKRQGRSFLTSLAELGMGLGIPSLTGRGVLPFLTQAYEGDLTLMPPLGLEDFAKLLENPSQARVKEAIAVGQHMTWPHIPWLRVHCLVEATLDACLRRLRGRWAGLAAAGEVADSHAFAQAQGTLHRSGGVFGSSAAFGHGLAGGGSAQELQGLAGAEAAGGPPQGAAFGLPHAQAEVVSNAAQVREDAAAATAAGEAAVHSAFGLSPHDAPRRAADPGHCDGMPSLQPESAGRGRNRTSGSSSRASAPGAALLEASSSIASLTEHFGFDTPAEPLRLRRVGSGPQEVPPGGAGHAPGLAAGPGAAAPSHRLPKSSPHVATALLEEAPRAERATSLPAHASSFPAAASPTGFSQGWRRRGSAARLALLHEMEEDGRSEGEASGPAVDDAASLPSPVSGSRGLAGGRRAHRPLAPGLGGGSPQAVAGLSASSLRAVGLAMPPTAAVPAASIALDRPPLVDWSSGFLQGIGFVSAGSGHGTDSRSSRSALAPLEEGDSGGTSDG